VTDDDISEKVRRAVVMREARLRVERLANIEHDNEPLPDWKRQGLSDQPDWRHRPRQEFARAERQRGTDTAGSGVDQQFVFDVIGEIIAHERSRAAEIFAKVAASMRDDDRAELARLREELRETKLELAKMTSILATVREERAGGPVDMPSPLVRRSDLN